VSLSQYDRAGAAQLLHFVHEPLRWLHPERGLGAHAQRTFLALDVELEENAAIAAMTRQQFGERFEGGPCRSR
jgi:hypothetical protein